VNVSGGGPSRNQLTLTQVVYDVDDELVEDLAAPAVSPVMALGKALGPQTLKAPVGDSGTVQVRTWLMECFKLHYFWFPTISLLKRMKECGYPACVLAKKYTHRHVTSLVDNVLEKAEREYLDVADAQKIPPSDRQLQAVFGKDAGV
jgi:hypothetical protein